ncbi:lytic transglycosylase domain-containing protein [Labrenzia sp. ac12]
MRTAILLLLTRLLLECASAHAEPASSETSRLRAAGDPYATHIAEASQRFGIPAHWIRAVLDMESDGNPNAVSAAGAMGLMQLMPGTWEELRIRYGLNAVPFDPHDNILAGTAYLLEMYDRYGDITGMLAAYNAGPVRYDAYLEDCRALPAETRTYVALLAPALGSYLLPDTSGASARSPDWRDAPLFAALNTADVSANWQQFDGRSSAAPNAAETSHRYARSGTAETLFVSRSSGEGF